VEVIVLHGSPSMKLTLRVYQNDEDYWRIRELLASDDAVYDT
jgi:hypothetical protein